MKLIWHFVGFVLAAVRRKSLCLIKDWENRPGKSHQVFCVRDNPKVRMEIKMPIQEKAIRCGERSFVVTESQELHTLESQ